MRVPTLPMRPTVLEVKDDIPVSTRDGCISDFVNPAVVNCTYGDADATRTHRAGRRVARRTLAARAASCSDSCTTSKW